jgi:hypothetical protein
MRCLTTQRLALAWVMVKPKFRCPYCDHVLTVSDYAKFLGSLGGSTTGPKKARTSEQARAAANALDRTFPDLHDRYWLTALLSANLFLALRERSSISGFKTIKARWALRLAQFEGLHPWLIPGC